MTGYASHNGQGGGYSWSWDLRSVNGKGLDIRLRVPDWIDGLEPAIREQLGKQLKRGNVSLSLRVVQETSALSMRVDQGILAQTLQALSMAEQMAEQQGVVLRSSSAAELLGQKGVMVQDTGDQNTDEVRKLLIADLGGVIEAFQEMRASEGAALHEVLTVQLSEVSELVRQAKEIEGDRRDKARQKLQDALTRVIDNTDHLDEGRVAQELALIAVKADITEELDRLTAHVDAAQELLAQSGPIGRKLDFLMQEFNREANTLCSKSQFTELTRIGLDLKATIDQMREQVQNVE